MTVLGNSQPAYLPPGIPPQTSWQLLASTGIAGFTLVNGTPNVITWTAPNDGNMHRVLAILVKHVTSNETGGQVAVNGQTPDGIGLTPSPFAGGQASGTYQASSVLLVPPGASVTVKQNSALTVGATSLWAELWGA